MTPEGFPQLESLYRALKEKGLAVLAVNGLEETETIGSFAEKEKFSFPVLARKERDLLPDRLYRAVNMSGIFVIGRDGKILWAQRDFGLSKETGQALRTEVEKALKK